MTDLETAIMIKNMARETVRRMTAKNASMPDRLKSSLSADISAAKRGEGYDFHFIHGMSKKDRDDMDRWLVEIGHPLAYEPGTQADRYKRLVKEGMK